jgi:hypothetical protein
LSGQALGGCLRAAGWARLTAHGGGAHPLSVTHGSLILPILLTVEGKRTQIRTRLPARRHQGIALHTAVAGCLPGTRLEDAALGELAQADTWPSARRDSGLRAELLMRIAPSAKGLTLRGLGRLGLKDLVFDAPDTPATRRRLLQAGTLLLLQDDPRATTLPFGESEARLNPSPQPGLENAHRIDLPVPPVAPITAPPVSKRPRARPVRRPKARRGSPKTPKSAPRTTPRRPTPATPRWRPDYVD